jgi:hypothetical protein
MIMGVDGTGRISKNYAVSWPTSDKAKTFPGRPTTSVRCFPAGRLIHFR